MAPSPNFPASATNSRREIFFRDITPSSLERHKTWIAHRHCVLGPEPQLRTKGFASAHSPPSLPTLTPHSSLSRFPLPLRHRGNKAVQALRRKLEGSSLFGALIARHQDAHDIETILEGQARLFL